MWIKKRFLEKSRRLIVQIETHNDNLRFDEQNDWLACKIIWSATSYLDSTRSVLMFTEKTVNRDEQLRDFSKLQ